ncbi:MAG: CRISPR-associated helicase Cas3' [bacterium]
MTLWGKSEPYKALWQHMLDVGAVAAVLLGEVFAQPVKRRICQVMDIGVPDPALWVAYLTALHDAGKATPDFQGLYDPGRCVVQAAGLRVPPARGAMPPHGASTANILLTYLNSECSWSEDKAVCAATALGGHHGVFPTSIRQRAWGGTLNKSERQSWQTVQSELMRLLACAMGLGDLTTGRPSSSVLAWLDFAGFVSVADWIGSAAEFTCGANTPDTPPEYYSAALESARTALKTFGWCQFSPPASFPDYHAQFGWTKERSPRPLQIAVADAMVSHPNTRLLIVEAPMGEGKTEAALYAARQGLDSLAPAGVYFALPTMATSNAMFARVTSWLSRVLDSQSADLHLLHGAAWRNTAYDQIVTMTRLLPAQIFDDDNSGDSVGGVTAHDWFMKSKRGLLAPFGAGTIDQALVAVLRCRHHFVRMHALGSKTVIFDEVHAYDTYMSELLDRLIAFILKLGGRVVVLSATLPRKRLAKLLGGTVGYTGDGSEWPDYPRIAFADSNGSITVRTFPATPYCAVIGEPPCESKVINLEFIKGGAEGAAVCLLNRISSGGCAALICNTVGAAQKAHVAAEQAIAANVNWAGADLHLFHARFPAETRDVIEQGVLDKFGPPGPGGTSPNRPQRALVIATQVIEQSLDLDFDIMATEIAPIDLVLQRCGRLWRHARPPRPVTAPRLIVIEPETAHDDSPDFGGSGYVYERAVLMRSYVVLMGRNHLCVPHDLEPLINLVYRDDVSTVDMPEAWHGKYCEAVQEETAAIEKQRRLAISALAPSPDDLNNEEYLANAQIFRTDDTDDPALHEHFRAVTRLGDPSLECICLHEVDGRLAFDEAGTDMTPTAAPPGPRTVLRLLNRVVRISNRAVVHALPREHPPPKGWSRCASLRRCSVLGFKNGFLNVGGRRLEWRPVRGIIIEKEVTPDT